ncbi:MAG: hypothetical protein Q4D60_08790 [Eubacteriales bacterium]|nr:hypothetical protein [Eubacteriales bacterium]
MSERMKKELFSLKEICGEERTETDGKGRTKKRTVHFSSMEALIDGALHFVEFFERLHREGKVYRSSEAEGFLFSGRTGALCVPASEEGPAELSEFLAPELVEAMAEGKMPEELPFTVETDRYFIAVFLFEYFFHTGSPFEGKRMVNRCFLSPMEKELFRAREGQFCMEVGEESNTPVKGIQDKLIFYWEQYPDILKKMFQRAFMDGGRICELRPTEVDWKQTFVRMAVDYKRCSCGFCGFSFSLEAKGNGTFACPDCGRVYYPLTNGMDRILLAAGEKLYECQTGKDVFDKEKVTAMVVENRQRKGLYGIKNMSGGVWVGRFPDGTVKEIGEGQGIPIWSGMSVRFEVGEEWHLRQISQTEGKEIGEDEQQVSGAECGCD